MNMYIYAEIGKVRLAVRHSGCGHVLYLSLLYLLGKRQWIRALTVRVARFANATTVLYVIYTLMYKHTFG